MAVKQRSANKSKQTKRAAPKSAWRKGQSGNPSGRPKDGVSFASVLREYLAMDGKQVAEICKTYAREFRALPEGVDLRSMIALRWIMAVLNEPSPGLMQQLVDRVDGVVAAKTEVQQNVSGYMALENVGDNAREQLISRMASIEARIHQEKGTGEPEQ